MKITDELCVLTVEMCALMHLLWTKALPFCNTFGVKQ